MLSKIIEIGKLHYKETIDTETANRKNVFKLTMSKNGNPHLDYDGEVKNCVIVCKKRGITRDRILRINIDSYNKFVEDYAIPNITEFEDFCKMKNCSNSLIDFFIEQKRILSDDIEMELIAEKILETLKAKNKKLLSDDEILKSAYVYFVYTDEINIINSIDNKEMLELGYSFSVNSEKVCPKYSDLTADLCVPAANYESIKPLGGLSKFFSANNKNFGNYPEMANPNFNFIVGTDEQIKYLKTGIELLKDNKIIISEDLYMLYWKQPKKITDDFGDEYFKNYDVVSENNFKDLMATPEEFYFMLISNTINPGRLRILDSGCFDITEYSKRRNLVYNSLSCNSDLVKMIHKNELFKRYIFNWYIKGDKANITPIKTTLIKTLAHGRCSYNQKYRGFEYTVDQNTKLLTKHLNILTAFGGNMGNEIELAYGKLLAVASRLEEGELYSRLKLNRASKFRNIKQWLDVTDGLNEMTTVMTRIKRHNTKTWKTAVNELLETLGDDTNCKVSDLTVYGFLKEDTKTEEQTQKTSEE